MCSSRRLFLVASLLLASILALGCDGKVRVSGKITYPDGSPLTCGQIVFTDDYYMAKSDVDREGNYYLHSFKRRDGIRKGVYKVYICSAFQFEEIEADPEELKRGLVEFKPGTQCIDQQYMCPDASGWIRDVKKSSTFNFTVYRPGEVPDSERSKLAREWFDGEKTEDDAENE